jgi:hypothetical protein
MVHTRAYLYLRSDPTSLATASQYSQRASLVSRPQSVLGLGSSATCPSPADSSARRSQCSFMPRACSGV